MQGQVIGARKAAIAISALEGFGSSVLAIVTSQFIAPCETPFTAFPRALVGLLTYNDRESYMVFNKNARKPGLLFIK